MDLRGRTIDKVKSAYVEAEGRLTVVCK